MIVAYYFYEKYIYIELYNTGIFLTFFTGLECLKLRLNRVKILF